MPLKERLVERDGLHRVDVLANVQRGNPVHQQQGITMRQRRQNLANVICQRRRGCGSIVAHLIPHAFS
jgi:hypothetical protein